MPDIRTVLFDLDGTLADTAPDLADCLNQMRGEQGQAPLPYALIRPEASHGSRALLRLGFGVTPDDAEFTPLQQRFLEIYQHRLCDKTRLFPGMRRTLERLRERGLNWGIVTNKPAWLTEPLVERLGIRREAVCVISGDTTANSKPHPEPMLHACQLAGSPPEATVYVGDAERDIQAGRQAGTHTLVALFGYIGHNEHPRDWGADGAIEQPEDLLNWLDQHAGH
jgi:phosphoglycolate phosphatase